MPLARLCLCPADRRRLVVRICAFRHEQRRVYAPASRLSRIRQCACRTHPSRFVNVHTAPSHPGSSMCTQGLPILVRHCICRARRLRLALILVSSEQRILDGSLRHTEALLRAQAPPPWDAPFAMAPPTHDRRRSFERIKEFLLFTFVCSVSASEGVWSCGSTQLRCVG